MACSMALRAPTPRKSTERQLGQRLENSNVFLTVGFSGASDGGGQAIAERAAAGGYFGLVAAADVRAAGFFGGFDLFGSADVGLGELHFLARAFHLAFVALG